MGPKALSDTFCVNEDLFNLFLLKITNKYMIEQIILYIQNKYNIKYNNYKQELYAISDRPLYLVCVRKRFMMCQDNGLEACFNVFRLDPKTFVENIEKI